MIHKKDTVYFGIRWRVSLLLRGDQENEIYNKSSFNRYNFHYSEGKKYADSLEIIFDGNQLIMDKVIYNKIKEGKGIYFNESFFCSIYIKININRHLFDFGTSIQNRVLRSFVPSGSTPHYFWFATIGSEKGKYTFMIGDIAFGGDLNFVNQGTAQSQLGFESFAHRFF